jgi:hypothetical protein
MKAQHHTHTHTIDILPTRCLSAHPPLTHTSTGMQPSRAGPTHDPHATNRGSGVLMPLARLSKICPWWLKVAPAAWRAEMLKPTWPFRYRSQAAPQIKPSSPEQT